VRAASTFDVGMRAAFVVLAAIVACGRSVDAPVPQRPALVASASASAPVDAAIADAAPDVVDAGAPDEPSSIAFLIDGTLLVVGRRTLLARAPDGTTQQRRLAEDASVEWSDGARGAIITTKDFVELVATPSLATLHHGGEPTTITRTALVVDEGHAVVLQHGGSLLRLVLPPERRGTRVTSVVEVAAGSRVNVSYETDDDGFAGTLFDATSGAIVGAGFADRANYAYVPLSGVSNDAAFVVKGDRLARVDLATAKVTRQIAVGCGKDRTLGNPTPNARGDLVLVTCMDEGVVLDGTLKVLRRIPKILPGCDNGLFLGGVVMPDERTLLLTGCGGQARIDLTTGRYTCGDGAGIVGGPYEVVRAPGPAGSAWRPPSAPSGRDKLPRCTKTEGATMVGRTGRYRMLYGEQVTLESDGAKPIVLDASTLPAIAPDEKSFAYVRDAIVVVRALPGGEPIAEVRLGR